MEDSDDDAETRCQVSAELAYSWTKMLTPLADTGYRAIAPDLRGYGWDADFDDDLRQFRMLNVTRDVVALVSAMEAIPSCFKGCPWATTSTVCN